MRLATAAGGAVFGLLFAGSVAAQMDTPPAYLQIFREREKYGHVGPHTRTEAGWPAAFARAKIPNNYIAFRTMYGAQQAWFVELHSSIAELEAANQAADAAPGLNAELERLQLADAAHVESADALLLRYVPEASNPGNITASEMHVWEITIFRVRPGREMMFFEGANLFKSVVQSAHADVSWASYSVMAGMQGPVYMVFSPHKSLAEIDPATGAQAAVEKAMTEEIQKKFGTISENFISIETLVMTTVPEMSYPPEAWVKQDPKYWGRKAMPAAAPKPKP